MNRAVFFMLLVLNFILLVSNGFLTVTLRNVAATSRHQLDVTSTERSALSAERTRIELIARTLKEAVADLSRLYSGLQEEKPESPETKPARPAEVGPDRFARFLMGEGIVKKPDPATIPLMTPEEKEELRAILQGMPKLNEKLLLQGDVDKILEDREWNLEGRELSEWEMSELSRRMSEYRYYAKWSAIDRYKTYVEGELPRLREQGNFVEYPEGDPPGIVEDATYVHADHTGDSGTVQYYYFFPEEYPKLEHHRLVERERLADSYVRVYELINKAETDAQKE